MQRYLGVILAFAIGVAAFASDAAVSVRVGQPGFYGRIDIGGLPPPRVLYEEPIIVERAPAGVVAEPIYLRVPPGHAKHWRKHCAQYDACGRPVYFVQDGWYNDIYVPHYRRGAYQAVAPAPVPVAAYVYTPPAPERLYSVPVASVRAVVGPPEERCWVERQQVVANRGDVNVPGAIVGAVIGGVLGHQVGGGRGRDVATAGGAVAGAALGANVGRGGDVYDRDVQRCASVQSRAAPEYWDVTYRFHGALHRAQLSAPPGATIVVNERGEPRG